MRWARTTACLIGLVLGTGIARAGEEPPDADDTLTFPAGTGAGATSSFGFDPAEPIVVTVSGTHSRTHVLPADDDGKPRTFTDYWDPFYKFDCTGHPDYCTPGERSLYPLVLAVDSKQTYGNYSAAFAFTKSGTAPPYEADHSYRLVYTDAAGPVTFRDSFTSNDGATDLTGEWTVAFDYEPIVRFSFRHDVQLGPNQYTGSGKGTIQLRSSPRVNAGRASGRGEVDAPNLRLAVEPVDEDMHEVKLKVVGTGLYAAVVTQKAVYELVVLDVRVSRSRDPDCPTGSEGKLSLVEAKRGRGKVTVDLKGCRKVRLTKRQKGDKVTVSVKGPVTRGTG